MTKQEALAKIAEHLKQMEQSLKDAQALADEHSLSFKASFGGVDRSEYGGGEPVRGTYHGADGTEEPGEDKGYWYWENSSMNC